MSEVVEDFDKCVDAAQEYQPEYTYEQIMSWLWNKGDKKTYTLVALGHLECLTDEIIAEFKEDMRNER